MVPLLAFAVITEKILTTLENNQVAVHTLFQHAMGGSNTIAAFNNQHSPPQAMPVSNLLHPILIKHPQPLDGLLPSITGQVIDPLKWFAVFLKPTIVFYGIHTSFVKYVACRRMPPALVPTIVIGKLLA